MNKNKIPGVIFTIGVIAFVGMVAYLLMQGNKTQEARVSAPVTAVAIPDGDGLIETNPVLPAANFSGRVAKTYQYAAEIPKVLDSLYCYCKCSENPNFKHKTLLTCYTNEHATKCDICMHEAEMAYDMTKEGKSPKEIRAAVDAFYAKPDSL